MSLNIEQLRSFDSNWGNLVVQNGQNGASQVRSGGFLHALGSLFHTDAAKRRNEATLNAIRTAIQNDPRYFAEDVKARANELLGQIRSGSNVGAKRIKDIIRQLDEMSTPEKQKAAVEKVAVGHLAARGGAPAFAKGIDEETYAGLAKRTISQQPPHGNYSGIDVAGRLASFEQRLNNLYERVGDDPETRKLFEYFVNRGDVLAAKDGGLKTTEKLNAFVDALKANVAEARQLAATQGPDFFAKAIDFVKSVGKPLPNGVMDRLADAATNMPKFGLDKLDANSSAHDIDKALKTLTDKLKTTDFGLAFEADSKLAAQSFVMKCAIAKLPAETKRNILDALESRNGRNLQKFYNSALAFSSDMSILALSNTLATVVEEIKTSLGLPDPTGQIEEGNDYDPKTLPPDLMARYSIETIVSGTNAKPIRKALNNPALYPEGTPSSRKPRVLQEKMNATAKNEVATTIGQQIEDDLTVKDPETGKKMGINFDRTGGVFDRDLWRNIDVYMPDGTRLGSGPGSEGNARDEFAKLVSGDDKATFKGADAELKAKVYVLMTCLNQALGGVGLTSFGCALDPEGKMPAIAPQKDASMDRKLEYRLSKNEAGDISIHCEVREYMMSYVVPDEQGMPQVTMVGKGSYNEFSLDIDFPRENLDKLGRADWSSYNHATMGKLGADRIPDQFRFTGTVTTATHYHIEA